jgi:hypothetical protein
MLALKNDITINNKNSIRIPEAIIPVEQQNTKLINAIFDRQTKFKQFIL